MKITQYNQDGFTLLEAVIALSVLSIGILALMVMITTSIRGNAVANITTTQTHIGIDQLERFSSLSYKAAPLKDKKTVRTGVAYRELSAGDVTAIEAALENADSPEHELASADFLKGYDGRYNVKWNVEDDYPFPGTKTVVLIVDSPANNTETMFRYIKYKN